MESLPQKRRILAEDLPALEEEIRLQTAERERLKALVAAGDGSNDASQTDLLICRAEVKRLERLLLDAAIVEKPTQNDIVEIGHCVTFHLACNPEARTKVIIVGDWHHEDPLQDKDSSIKKVSPDASVARSLIGMRVGDERSFCCSEKLPTKIVVDHIE